MAAWENEGGALSARLPRGTLDAGLTDRHTLGILLGGLVLLVPVFGAMVIFWSELGSNL